MKYHEWYLQRAKKVVSNTQGLVDFAVGLVNSVFNLPDRQVKFFKEFKLQKNCEISLLIKTVLGLVEMMFGLVNVSFSLPEWQAEKMTSFVPCIYAKYHVQIMLLLFCLYNYPQKVCNFTFRYFKLR